jgi:CRP-like cAMP-binding protein
VVVKTSVGPIQLGAPPETIKDLIGAGLEVPAIYVLPARWFDRRRGHPLLELEFPVYYNYFLRHRRVTAVADAPAARRLRALLHESLFGPVAIDRDVDYDPSVPPGARADLLREADWFRRKEGDPGRHIAFDEVLAVSPYDEDGIARLEAVEIRRQARPEGGWRYVVCDGGRVIAEVDELLAEDEARRVPGAAAAAAAAAAGFRPPSFGITVLGSSHGFDPAGKTTGFVLWLNQRGILVDPPCDATYVLREAGISPRAVDAVVLTHCHADHDTGVFQKIVEAGRVSLYTTPTILGSFLRKYVAITEEPEESLRHLFVFHPVIIGASQKIAGADFRFFYALHSVPTLGFECRWGGQSFYYSGDTLWDAGRIAAMHAEGILGDERRAALLHFPQHHTLVLHEAGIPPIHTPAANLAALPEDVRDRLRLIHIAEADLPKDRGLRLARTGFDETIVLPAEAHPHGPALEALDALASIDLFRDFTAPRCREFLTVARREVFPAGSLVIGEGEIGDRFYLIVAGEASVVRGGVVIKTYRDGDFFGETALMTGAPRSADVRAKSDLVVLGVDKYDFLALVRGTDLAESLLRLARNRDVPSWSLMSDNGVLGELSQSQRTQLQSVLEQEQVAVGQLLWSDGDRPEAAWLLDDAEVEFQEGGAGIRLGRAALVGDIDALLAGRSVASRAVVIRAGAAFRLPRAPLTEFLRKTPALLLALSGAQYVV